MTNPSTLNQIRTGFRKGQSFGELRRQLQAKKGLDQGSSSMHTQNMIEA